MHETPHSVLAEYVDTVGRTNPIPLHSGGFSGAELWRIPATAGDFVLRRWPDGQLNAGRLMFIHGMLRHAARRGAPPVPVPVRSRAGATFVDYAGALWQLDPWLPGAAEVRRPPPVDRLTAACRALAGFHAAVVDFPAPERREGSSPAVMQRMQLWLEARHRGIEELQQALEVELNADSAVAQLRRRGQEFLQLFASARSRLEAAFGATIDSVVPLQPVIRDVTADHVLFTGDEVSGLIDFGSSAVDTPAVDLARLIGSFVGDDAALRDAALAAYETSGHGRSLTTCERQLVVWLDTTGVWLSPYRWLRWIFVERRQFADEQAVVQRFDALMQRVIAHETL